MRELALAALLVVTGSVMAQPNPAALRPKLEALAARGNAEALYHLGMFYQVGAGTAPDYRRALDYFRRSAAAGDPLGAYKLGCLYAGQDAVLPIDEEQALKWKLVAARAGYALAQQDVAAIYARRGDGVQAEAWLAKAAAQGWPDALFGYASLHNGENGRPRDGAIVVAHFTLFLATRQPDAEHHTEQQAWLQRQQSALTPEESARAERIVDTYSPVPTPLTIKALSGQRAAAALAAEQR